MRCFKINFAGGSPAAAYFLLSGQEKVSKEKAAPFAGPSDSPALLATPGGCGTRPRDKTARAQTVLAEFPRRDSAARRLAGGDTSCALEH